jgi:hypothetical protein
MNARKIRGFLLQNPKPSMVRVSGAECDSQELKPGRNYARCAETIEALAVDLIECFDAGGKLLRAHRVDSDDDEEQSSDVPLPPGLAADPNALMLTHFANLLHRAYKHSTEIAFVKMVDIVERMGERSESIEARLERTEAQNRRLANEAIEAELERAQELAEQRAEGGGDLVQNLAGAFLSGQLQGGAAKTNGAGTVKPNGTPSSKGQAQ